jgi:hypothetical protein
MGTNCVQKQHFEDAKYELQNLLGEKSLVGIPLLVVCLLQLAKRRCLTVAIAGKQE